jgi:ABC-type Fe3+/spermidine/putrescine transport system ATPase subunit
VADFIGESNFFDVAMDAAHPDLAVLPDGSKVGRPAGTLEPGPKATLMVRPESIRLYLPDEAPAGAIRATTVQTSFLGSYTRVAVRCDAVEEPVLVAVQGKGEVAVEALDTDKEVALWWRPDDAVLIGHGIDEEGNGA